MLRKFVMLGRTVSTPQAPTDPTRITMRLTTNDRNLPLTQSCVVVVAVVYFRVCVRVKDCDNYDVVVSSLRL